MGFERIQLRRQQVTAGQTYTMPDYSYDLSGALVSQTYHSGRVVAIETDNIGRLSGVTSQVPTMRHEPT